MNGGSGMNSSTRTDSHETISSSRAARWVAARWPTALGIIFLSGLFAFGFPAGTESWFVVFLSALVYLGAAALDQRRSAWAIFIVGLVGVVTLQAFDLSLGPALIAAAVILFLTGALRG
jgi:hypothetical protein